MTRMTDPTQLPGFERKVAGFGKSTEVKHRSDDDVVDRDRDDRDDREREENDR